MNRKQKVVTVSGKSAIGLVILNGNTSGTVAISANAIQRLANVQKGFEFYRFTKFNVLVPPFTRYETSIPFTSLAGQWGLAYYPEISTASMTSATVGGVCACTASLLGQCSIGFEAGGVPTVGIPGDTNCRTLRVPRSILLQTPTKWFRTNNTVTTEDTDIYQGSLVMAFNDSAGANTVSFYVHVDYTCEFSGPQDSTLLTLTESVMDSTTDAKSWADVDEKEHFPPPKRANTVAQVERALRK